MRIAISTEDGKTITKDHFGEGEFFLIYELDAQGYRLLERRENTSPPEEDHGSEKKAMGISSILKDIPVLVGYQFGPNIMRIKDKFLAIVSRELDIETALNNLVARYSEVERELNSPRGNLIVLDGERIRVVKVKDINAKDF